MDNLANRDKSAAPTAALMPNTVPSKANPSFTTIRNDFIRHPNDFPLEVRRLRTWGRPKSEPFSPSSDLGLSFTSRKYVPTGTEMEIAIPLRGDVQRFHGTVVMVREIADGYEIGIWLATADEATRARLVEQICHIECSLQTKRPVVNSSSNRDAKKRAPKVFGLRAKHALAN